MGLSNFDAVFIHFHEIVLKGKNRPFFEKHLAANIHRALSDFGVKNLENLGGSFLLKFELPENGSMADIVGRLSMIPGIANFLPVFETSISFDELKKRILKEFPKKKPETFKIDARRAEKSFPSTSMEMNIDLGAFVNEKLKIKVDLENPELTIFVFAHADRIFFSFEKIKGAGGLPVGASGAVVCLLSGGIDSPVASQMIIKRGCRAVFVHFHAHPYVSTASMDKAHELAEVLDKYQYDSRLYFIPFGDIQKKVVLAVAPPYRVIVYRRLMMKIAEAIAKKENISALVTGESLGQVASQTLENMETVGAAVSMPVLRPLVGMDKEEIIEKAREIKTYEISARPDEDCCTLFTPAHPATRTTKEEMEKAEANLNIGALVKEAVESAELKIF